MTSPLYNPRNASFVLSPDQASLLLEHIWPGEFRDDEHKRFLRCLYLISKGSDFVRDELLKAYRRYEFFGDPDVERRIHAAWSRLKGFTCEHAIQAELKALCAVQIPSSLMHMTFDDPSSNS